MVDQYEQPPSAALADAVREYGEAATPQQLIERGVRRLRCVSTKALGELIDQVIAESLELHMPAASADQRRTIARHAHSGLLDSLRGIEDVEVARRASAQPRDDAQDGLVRSQRDAGDRPPQSALEAAAQREDWAALELDARCRLTLSLRAAFGRSLMSSSAPSRAQVHEYAQLEREVLRITTTTIELALRQVHVGLSRAQRPARAEEPRSQAVVAPPRERAPSERVVEPPERVTPLSAATRHTEDLDEESGERIALIGGERDAREVYVDRLERRIGKLMASLAEAEQTIQRLTAMKDVEPGLPSVYRAVEGLSERDRLAALKRKILAQVFEANVELQLRPAAGTR